MSTSWTAAFACFAWCLCCAGDASILDSLSQKKCSFKDDACTVNLFQVVLRDYSRPGVPELDIPPFDPLHLSNVTVEVLDSIRVTIVDGVAQGASGCSIKRFHLDADKQVASQEIFCDLAVKGDIAVTGTNPLLQSFLEGSSIDTKGKFKVKLDNITVKYDIPTTFVKKDDGETYVKINIKKIKLDFDIQKATFQAENIVIGKEDISKFLVAYLNDNWRTLVKNFGTVFVKKALDLSFVFLDKFFAGVPTKYYFIEDMTPYVDN